MYTEGSTYSCEAHAVGHGYGGSLRDVHECLQHLLALYHAQQRAPLENKRVTVFLGPHSDSSGGRGGGRFVGRRLSFPGSMQPSTRQVVLVLFLLLMESLIASKTAHPHFEPRHSTEETHSYLSMRAA